MLNTSQNTELVVEMLEYLLLPYLMTSEGSANTIRWETEEGAFEYSLQDGLANVVESRGPNRLVSETLNFVNERLTRSGQENNAAKLLQALLIQLEGNFFLLAEINDQYLGQRIVLKYSRDDDVPSAAKGRSSLGLRQAPYDQLPNAIDLDLPEFSTAASFHLEVQLPPGLVITELSIQQYELDSDGNYQQISSDIDRPESERTTAQVTLAAKHSLAIARAQVFVMPASQGIVRFTNVTVFIISVIAMVGLVEVASPSIFIDRQPDPNSSLASLVLALPAFFLSWMARAPEHTLVAQVLEAHRRVLFFLSISLFGFAALIAISFQPDFLEWISLIAGATILWAILQLLYLHFSMRIERRASMLRDETIPNRLWKGGEPL